MANHNHGAQAAHGSLKSYLIGFALAIVLTLVPFGLAMGGYFSPAVTAGVVLAIAAVQIVVHLIYFLHIDPKSEGGWNMIALVFTGVILVIVLAGSIWTMQHLNDNMMPMSMSPADARNLP